MIDHNQQLASLKEIREMIVNDVRREDYLLFKRTIEAYPEIKDMLLKLHPKAKDYNKLIKLEKEGK